MEIQKVKLTQLPKTDQLDGTITLSVTEENVSSALDLTAVADAATSANEAATNANQAAENANTSAANADAKAEAAQKAADNATASANQADQAAVNANTATTRATAAAEKAENAADVAIGVVNEAQQATANANQAAQSANEAATNANQAATSANDAATEAHTQAEYAKTQGDYAKAEGDRVLAEKGQPGGLAELDESGRVPSSQLPSYVDDVVEYPSRSDFPATGESGKIYVATDTNLAYRWGGTEYVEISPSLALGTTAETAGRGDLTQAAYNHSLIKDGSNPHKTTFASLPDKPTSLPASDVYPWAKAASKPTYTAAEVGALPLSGGVMSARSSYPQLSMPMPTSVSGDSIFLQIGVSSDSNVKLRRYNVTSDSFSELSLSNTGLTAILNGVSRTIYHSGNFNPDDKFGFNATQLSDLNNAPNNAFFVGAYNATNSPVQNSWSNGFTIAYGNNTDFKKQFCYAGEKWWTRGRDGTNWGAWRQIWDSRSFNPANYLNANKGLIADLNTATDSGVYYFSTPGSVNTPEGYGSLLVVTTIDNGSPWINQFAFGTSNKIWHRQNINNRGWNSWTYLYDSGNLGNATTSQAGLMSAADKTKLDGLSGGGLNIPTSGEVAISGWTYNGKQVYAQRWTGEFTGVTKNLTTIEGLSAILMKGGTLFLYGSQSNSVGLGSSQWNQTTGDITRISDLQYNLSTGSVTVAAWYGGTSSPTTVNWSYEVWAAYTK